MKWMSGSTNDTATEPYGRPKVPFFHGWPAPALAALGVVMEAREYNTAEVTTRHSSSV